MSTGILTLGVLGFLLVVGIVGFAVWYFTHAMVKSGEKGQKAVFETATPGEAKIIEDEKNQKHFSGCSMGRTVLLAGRINGGNCENIGMKTIAGRPPNTGFSGQRLRAAPRRDLPEIPR